MADEICPDCRAGEDEKPHDGPGVPIRMPGMVHKSTCPRVSWIDETRKRAQRENPFPNGHGFIHTPDAEDYRRIERENADLRRRVERLERAAPGSGSPNEPRRIWLKVDLFDATCGPYDVVEWNDRFPVIVGQDGDRIHLPDALWEPLPEQKEEPA